MPAMSDRKKAHACSSCDAELWDALTRFEAPHPFEDQIRKAGAVHEDAMRVTFVLTDGSNANMSMCRACADALQPSDLPKLWRRVMAAFAYEREHYEELSGHQQEPTPEQKAAVERDLAKLRETVPLGVLHAEPWSAVMAREMPDAAA